MPADSNSLGSSLAYGPDGHSSFGPSISGDDLYGLVAVWSDSEKDDQLGFSTRLPGTETWQPPIYPGASRSRFAPGITLAYDWFDVAIAWTDEEQRIQLILTSQPKRPVAMTEPAGASGSPALAYGDDAIWCAYQVKGALMLAGYYKNGTTQTFALGAEVSGDPSLTFYQGSLWFGLGGTVKEAARMAIYTCTVTDPVNTFVAYPNGPTFTCCGAPAISIQDGLYCLAYADERLTLRIITTKDRTKCVPENHSLRCSGANVSSAFVLGTFNVGLTTANGTEDSGSDRLCLYSLPLLSRAPNVNPSRRSARVEAKAPCADGLILDPSSGKCVVTTSCIGKCVMTSMGIRGVFNPIAFAYCVWKNC